MPSWTEKKPTVPGFPGLASNRNAPNPVTISVCLAARESFPAGNCPAPGARRSGALPRSIRARAEGGAPFQRADALGRAVRRDQLSQCDAVLILTDHSGVDYRWVVERAQLVIDTRNATCSIENHREKIVKA